MEITEQLARHILACHHHLNWEDYPSGFSDEEQEVLNNDYLPQVRKQIEVAFPILRQERKHREFEQFCLSEAALDPRNTPLIEEWDTINKKPTLSPAQKLRLHEIAVERQALIQTIVKEMHYPKLNESWAKFEARHCLICGEFIRKPDESEHNPRMHKDCQPHPS